MPNLVQRDYSNVAHQLRSDVQWLLHNPVKAPCDLQRAVCDKTDPQVYATFEAVVNCVNKLTANGWGIGYAIQNGKIFLDLDNCIVDGKLADWAYSITHDLIPTYTEVSPGGKGLKLVWSVDPGDAPANSFKVHFAPHTGAEVLVKNAFSTVTGNVWSEPRQIAKLPKEQIDLLCSRVRALEHLKKQAATSSGKIVHPNRHQALNDFAFKMRKQGYSLPVITAATIQFDKENCDPIKGEQYIREKIVPGIHSVQAEVKTFLPAIISSAEHFSLKEFKEMEPLVVVKKSNSPVIHHPTAGEIHAFRGVGKTNVAVGLLNCIATGGDFLAYHAPKPRKILYVDGEMAGADLQKILHDLAEENTNFNVLAIEEQPDYQIPSIATAEGLAWVEEAISRINAEVVCFDSWSTLANIGTNDEESWQVFMAWVKKMRLRGVTVFYLQHDGKTGLQRGHSKPEDLLNWVIHLKWENGYKGAEGLKCQLFFEKARRPVRECSRLNISLIEQDGKTEWAWSLPGEKQVVVEKKTGRKAIPPTPEQQAFLNNLTTEQEQNASAVARALGVSRKVADRWLTDKIEKRREKLISPEDYVGKE